MTSASKALKKAEKIQVSKMANTIETPASAAKKQRQQKKQNNKQRIVCKTNWKNR
jgi:hypothetical protein